MSLEPYAWSNQLDPATGKPVRVRLYLDLSAILAEYGKKALTNKSRKARSLSGALLVKVE